jgi:hypothetical protein
MHLVREIIDLRLLTVLFTEAPRTAALFVDDLFEVVEHGVNSYYECQIDSANFRNRELLAFDHKPKIDEVDQKKIGAVGVDCKRFGDDDDLPYDIREDTKDEEGTNILGALANLHTSSILLRTLAARGIIEYHWSVPFVTLLPFHD